MQVVAPKTAILIEEVVMARADNPSRPIGHEGRKSLYVTSGAMLAGLLGVFLFAAPGGVIGALTGALSGFCLAQYRSAA